MSDISPANAATTGPEDNNAALEKANSNKELTAPGALLEKIADARVQNVHLRVEREEGATLFFQVILEIFAGEKIFLQLSSKENDDDNSPTISLLSERLPGQQPPPAAQKLLREHLLNARLKKVSWVHSSLLSIEFVDVKARPRTFFVELDERDPRLVLAAGQSDEERETQKQKEEKKARKQAGKKKKRSISDDECPSISNDKLVPDGIEKILLQLGHARPSDGRDVRRGRPYQFPVEKESSSSLMSEVISHDAPKKKAKTVADPFRELRGLAKSAFKKKQRLKFNLEQDLARHGEPEHHIRCGEWFKMVMGKVARGQKTVVFMDFEGQERELELQPHLGPKENLELFFKKAKRAKQARQHIPPRLDALVVDIDELRTLRASIEAEKVANLDEDERTHLLLAGKEQVKGALKTSARRQAALGGKRRSWRVFRTGDNVLMRVGRSAKDNDDLTFHHTPGNDYWVHSRGLPGSHVVFSCGKEGPSENILLDAAHLAIWFSPLRDEERADVQWTQRKYVRKPAPGAPAGFVHLSNERVFHVRIEEKRLRLLLDGEEPAR
ncbi:MAG: DUF814 domain-containing protein [Deltaproteobacteria bacterium]|nr:DUF814 domain-containing protein [Deltaproteobacteria bacterium]